MSGELSNDPEIMQSAGSVDDIKSYTGDGHSGRDMATTENTIEPIEAEREGNYCNSNEPDERNESDVQPGPDIVVERAKSSPGFESHGLLNAPTDSPVPPQAVSGKRPCSRSPTPSLGAYPLEPASQGSALVESYKKPSISYARRRSSYGQTGSSSVHSSDSEEKTVPSAPRAQSETGVDAPDDIRVSPRSIGTSTPSYYASGAYDKPSIALWSTLATNGAQPEDPSKTLEKARDALKDMEKRLDQRDGIIAELRTELTHEQNELRLTRLNADKEKQLRAAAVQEAEHSKAELEKRHKVCEAASFMIKNEKNMSYDTAGSHKKKLVAHLETAGFIDKNGGKSILRHKKEKELGAPGGGKSSKRQKKGEVAHDVDKNKNKRHKKN